MGKKYIIELPEGTYWIQWIMKGIKDGHHYMDFNDVEDLTPYIEPDLEQIRKEAYEEGKKQAKAQAELDVCNDIEKVAKENYKAGLNDAWEAAKKIYLPEDHGGLGYKMRGKVFDTDNIGWTFKNLSASKAIEKIRQYEQKKKETEEAKKETEIKVEDVMRLYLSAICNNYQCLDDKCPLHTPEFTCGRGKHFLSLNRVSDEEVRRAYAKVMKENNND